MSWPEIIKWIILAKLLNNEEDNKVPVAARHSKRSLLQLAVTTLITLSSIYQNSRIGLRFDVLPVIFSQREWAGVYRFEISRASVTFNRW